MITPEEIEAIKRSRLTAAASTSIKIAGLKVTVCHHLTNFNTSTITFIVNHPDERKLLQLAEPSALEKLDGMS